MIYEKTGMGNQVLERGVVSTLVRASGEAQISKIGPTYDPSVVPQALAVAADGSVWVALRSLANEGHSRVDRIKGPLPGRGLPNPNVLPTSVQLPRGWIPVLMASGDPTTGGDPGFLFALGKPPNQDAFSLMCVWVNPSWMPRKFPTLTQPEQP
jgi:hypothetical protein